MADVAGYGFRRFHPLKEIAFRQNIVGGMIGRFIPINRNRNDQLSFSDAFLVFGVRRGAQRVEVVEEYGFNLTVGNQIRHMLGDAAAGLDRRILIGHSSPIGPRSFFRLQAFGQLQAAKRRPGSGQ